MSDAATATVASPLDDPLAITRIRNLPVRYAVTGSILAPLQLSALSAGAVLALIALVWHAFGTGSLALLMLAQALIVIGFALFALLLAATMRPMDPGALVPWRTIPPFTLEPYVS